MTDDAFCIDACITLSLHDALPILKELCDKGMGKYQIKDKDEG